MLGISLTQGGRFKFYLIFIYTDELKLCIPWPFWSLLWEIISISSCAFVNSSQNNLNRPAMQVLQRSLTSWRRIIFGMFDRLRAQLVRRRLRLLGLVCIWMIFSICCKLLTNMCQPIVWILLLPHLKVHATDSDMLYEKMSQRLRV